MDNAIDNKDVLLVEDDPQGLDLYTILLTLRGYNATACKDGYEARKAYDEKKGAFRFIMTDGYYPGGDSMELIKHVRLKDKTIPIMLLSGTLGDWLAGTRGTMDFSRMIVRNKAGSSLKIVKGFSALDRLPHKPKSRFSPNNKPNVFCAA